MGKCVNKNLTMEHASIISQAPGRINIIGEHTDYNNGFVLPAAIDKKTTVWLKKNGHPSACNMKAGNLGEELSFDLTNFQPKENGWENYMMGVVHELQKLGAQFSGFDCEFEGDVPIGSGMSSSASLECSLAIGLNKLFDLGFDKWQLIKSCQMAEHNFVGIKCGIMDQFASTMGQKDQVMLLDCQSLEFEYFPFDLGDYQLLLLNTNVSHSLASSEYNTRRAECEEGVRILQTKFPTIQSLRDVSFEMLLQMADKLPTKVANRCRHVVLENDRVQMATKALVNKDFKQLGQLIYQSHFSLSGDYEVSCAELDFLVQQSLDRDYILGSRMMGGGFGGCTISIIEKNWVAPYIDLIAASYKKQFGINLSPYAVTIEDGAGLVTTKQ